MSDLPPKPAPYDTPAMIKWLEAHVEHLMGIVSPKAESPLAISSPASAFVGGVSDQEAAAGAVEPRKAK